MSDHTATTAEPEAERSQAPVREFNLLSGSGPGLLADLVAAPPAPSAEPKEG